MSKLLRDHIEAISPLTDEEFAYILSHFKIKKLKKHAYLVQADDHVKYEYFVVKGCLKAFVVDADSGKEFIYQFGVEDWWMTDRDAFFKGVPATVNISCLEDCELLGITLEDRSKLGKELWKFEHFLQVKANLGYTSLQKRLQIMIKGNAKDRYEQFVRQYPHLIKRIPKTFIASYLGVSRETLSRLYNS
ncbi:Crp/Fnr family transcriptional regulator [Mucilaginibacter sp. CAU 1740]|uniref:Crp/Fnr family transcriptional regulator n=1 Tax=Mucilaginibacter sp. CAU 1740 TaxID=3140365 RepID=UPI00325AFAE0